VNTFALLLGPPLLSALVAFVVKPYQRFVGWANVLLSLVSVGAAVTLWRHILTGEVLTAGPQESLRADALSVLLALCVSVVGAFSAWLGPGLHADDGYDAAQARKFRIFGNLFALTMLQTTNNGFHDRDRGDDDHLGDAHSAP
jgi:formate hydrogenlyase subunit 3/multisubunit Na+/H+ antiporter MnhD subunit